MFESDPSGATVEIELISGGVSDLDVFRAECMSGGMVVCDWETLESRLNDHTVSTLWWELMGSERRAIAEMAIKNTLFYTISNWRDGKQYCAGGEGDIHGADCLQNAMVRYLKFGSDTPPSLVVGDGSPGGSACYHQKTMASTEFCYVPDIKYNLPCNLVGCNGANYGHAMCGIRVVKNIDSLDNWIVFQYTDFDIKPGHAQMPNFRIDDLCVTIRTPSAIKCTGYSYKTVASWAI